MEILKIDNKKINEAEFAYLNKETSFLEILNKPKLQSFEPENNNSVLLKNVKYKIIKNILYIKGTRIYQSHLIRISEFLDLWSNRYIYILNENFCKLLENPPQHSDVIIHRLLLKNKTIKALEVPLEDDLYSDKYYYKHKQEDEFIYIMSIPFKLQEK